MTIVDTDAPGWKVFPSGDYELYTDTTYATVSLEYGSKRFRWHLSPTPHDYAFRITGWCFSRLDAIRETEAAVPFMEALAAKLKERRNGAAR